MTTPVSLVPLPVPAAPGAAAAVPDDVFASVLAALSGALGLPVPATPLPEAAPPPEAAHVVTTVTAAAPAGTAEPAPAVWTAVTQRPVLPAPDATATAPVRPEEQAPAHPATTDHSEVREAAPAVEQRRVPEAPAPAVPVLQEPQVTAPSPPVAAPRAEAPVTPTHHVRPALVEAARGLRHEGGGRASLVVRLDPPELGAVLVRLTVQDGRVDVTLRTPDLAARADLQAQSYDVQQVLRDQGFDLSSFDVAHGDVLPDGWGDAPDRGTPERGRRADGQPRTPVTDDGPAPEPSGTWL
jgi:chemotaxis protein MotD